MTGDQNLALREGASALRYRAEKLSHMIGGMDTQEPRYSESLGLISHWRECAQKLEDSASREEA